MARRLRLQFSGATYHIITRGNYRHTVFATIGARRAFERTLREAVVRYRWRVHAFVALSNHFHVALKTPNPNLVDGMHWLPTTFATRHNRFRRRQGHLFQGRYKSLLIQDADHLSRLVDYINVICRPAAFGRGPQTRALPRGADIRVDTQHKSRKGCRT